MATYLPPPPAPPAPPALADLTDVNMDAEDGPVGNAQLVNDGEAWVGRIPSIFAGTAGGAPAGSVWTQRADTPNGTGPFHGLCVVGSLVYYYDGGHPEFASYDLFTDTWTVLTPPTAVSGAIASGEGGAIYLLSTAGTERYSIADDTWTTGRAAAPFNTASAVTAAGRLWIASTNTRDDSKLSSYDPVTDTWSAAPDGAWPPGRFQWVASDGNAIYVGGGWEEGGAGWLSTLAGAYRYDPASAGWTTLPDMPRPLGSPAAAFLNGILYLVGGNAPNEADDFPDDLLAYSPAVNAWELVADGGVKRQNALMVGLASRLVLTQGNEGSGVGSNRDDTFIYG